MPSFIVYPLNENARNARQVMGAMVDAADAAAARAAASAKLTESGLLGSGPDLSDTSLYGCRELAADEAVLVRGYPLVAEGLTAPGV